MITNGAGLEQEFEQEFVCALCDGPIKATDTCVSSDDAPGCRDFAHVKCEVLASAEHALAAIRRGMEDDPEVEIGEVMQDDEVFDALTSIAQLLIDVAKVGERL